MIGLGKRLKELRIAKGFTQAQVAERVGVSKAMVSAYELSSRMPPYDTLVKMAVLYGVSTDYLLGMRGGKAVNVEGLSDRQIAILAEIVREFKNRLQ